MCTYAICDQPEGEHGPCLGRNTGHRTGGVHRREARTPPVLLVTTASPQHSVLPQPSVVSSLSKSCLQPPNHALSSHCQEGCRCVPPAQSAAYTPWLNLHTRPPGLKC